MGERQLLAALAALCLIAVAPAQGPGYRERWGYMQLERLRAEVWQQLDGRDSESQQRVAALLCEPDGGLPFVPTARALAHLRGVEADSAFVLRATLGVFLLPEVVDPEARSEVCRDLNASLFLPYTVAQPGALQFRVAVHDRAGAQVFESTVTKDTDVAELRRARAVVKVPGEELRDGSYELEVTALVDGRPPRPSDPVLRLSFHVLRGYQQRSEAAMSATRDLHERLDPPASHLLLGLAAEVSRAYQGEAFSGQSRAVLDLQRLEVALENVRQQRPVLHGLSGDVPVLLPTGERPLGAVLRLDASRVAATGSDARPLVVFAGGVPSYDPGTNRPSSPATQEARALADALPGFGSNEPWQVAFLESPGGGRDYAAALPAAIGLLRELLATGDRPVVLVCEREAASVAGFALPRLRPVLDGVAFVGGGAMPAATLDGLEGLPVRLLLLHGYPASEGLARVLSYVEHKSAVGEWSGDLALLGEQRPPWPFGLQSAAGPIAAFVRQLASR